MKRGKEKATHQGSCQVCGRLQKLPDGVLAKHGYNVTFGFFNGTCWGSGHKPFEKAFDLVQKSVNLATEQRDRLLQAVAELESAPITNEAPFYRYITAKTRREYSGYREEIVKLCLNSVSERVWDIEFSDGKREPGFRYSLYGTLEEIVNKLRSERIEQYNKDIENRNSYIRWQQHRIDTWKEQPLVEVKEEETKRSSSSNHTLRLQADL